MNNALAGMAGNEAAKPDYERPPDRDFVLVNIRYELIIAQEQVSTK